jgi:hypothetical protein
MDILAAQPVYFHSLVSTSGSPLKSTTLQAAPSDGQQQTTTTPQVVTRQYLNCTALTVKTGVNLTNHASVSTIII